MARMSRDGFNGAEDMSVQIPLLQNHVLANDQSVRRHFLQRGQHAVHVLIVD